MEDVFCICRGPDDGSLMIECNYCSEWFHLSCLGLSQDDLKGLDEYRCEVCKSRGSTPPPTEGADDPKLFESETKRKKRKKSRDAGTKKDKKTHVQIKQEEEARTRQVRDTVAQNLTSILSAHLEELEDVKLKKEGLTALGNEIETALYETFSTDGHCGQPYRTKYLSLLFNLKDAKNARLRVKLFSGDILPAQLVRMTPADMANEELSQMIKAVREESIAQAVIHEEETGTEASRKTHKGEEPFRRVDDVLLPPSFNAPILIPSLNLTSTSDITLPLNISRQEDEYKTEEPADWNGLVLLQDVANFEARASCIEANTHLSAKIRSQLPASMHITGRIAPPKALSYLSTLKRVPTRRTDVLWLEAVFTENDGSKGDPSRLLGYLEGSDRWAVVQVGGGRESCLRDLYLVPFSHASRLVQAGVLSSDAVNSGGDRILLAILVTSHH